jgi:hypothetical protein
MSIFEEQIVLFKYRSFRGCIYRLDIDRDGIFCKASKLMFGDWEPLELTLRAMLLIDSEGKPLTLDQALYSDVESLHLEERYTSI